MSFNELDINAERAFEDLLSECRAGKIPQPALVGRAKQTLEALAEAYRGYKRGEVKFDESKANRIAGLEEAYRSLQTAFNSLKGEFGALSEVKSKLFIENVRLFNENKQLKARLADGLTAPLLGHLRAKHGMQFKTVPSSDQLVRMHEVLHEVEQDHSLDSLSVDADLPADSNG